MWLFFVPYAGEEENLGYLNLVKNLNTKLDSIGKKLNNYDRPFFVYVSACGYEDANKNYITASKIMRDIYENSRKYDYNYCVLYTDKDVYHKFDTIPFNDIKDKLIKQINFVKPKFIFIHDNDVFYKNDYQILSRVYWELIREYKHVSFLETPYYYEEYLFDFDELDLVEK
jgi:hypothetical protein